MLPLLLTLATTTPLAALASPLSFFQHHQKRNIGGVRLCDQPNWGGNCWYGIMPLDTCVALNSFAGKVLSFRPDEGTECFLMQRRCDSDDQFISFENDSENVDDLSGLDWIGDANSFMCVEEK